MKKTIIGILLWTATAVCAQTQPVSAPQWSDFCDSVMRILEQPYYYCACDESSSPFSFPYEEEVKDTMWFTATMNDLRQGISAYWFASSSVTMEVYAFCSSKEPTITMTVGPNQMRDIDVEKINRKLDEMGDMAALAEKMTPHIRVYPNGGSGHVYCYPYDQGPHSTCEEPIPLRSGMTYVCDKEENVYCMEYSQMPSSGKAFVHWKQKKHKPCEIWLTLDSCTGEEVGRAALSDSLHVYQPDSATLVDARKAKRSIWLHVKHGKDIVGRLYWYNNPKYEEQLPPMDKKTCLGKTLSVNFRTYSSDTAFVDTTWVGRDTLQTMEVKFTFTQPKLEYDTVHVTAVELNRGYVYKTANVILKNVGDTIVEAKKTNTCTRRIQVTVLIAEGYEYVGASRGNSRKVIQNGQLFIYIDDRKYNVLGQEIK